MKFQRQVYRKNFLLIALFLVLISVSLVFALTLAYNLTKRYVENEFTSQKIDVLEQTIGPYNDFFQNKVPEISFYQGYLDSQSVINYVDTIINKFPFVERVIFYDAAISNHAVTDGFRVNDFTMQPKAVYQFGKTVPADSVVLFKNSQPNSLSLKTSDEFNKMAIKLTGYIESSDTTKSISADERFNSFYNIASRTITFMNIPRTEDLKIYKDLMYKVMPESPVYEQDIFTFYLDPSGLKINNSHPELYENIQIQPLVYESLAINPEQMYTDIPLPGAFAEYKLYFSSPKSYLTSEINSRFLPIAGSLLVIYSFLAFIAYLIYGNMNVNRKMFKLQYDFINNLTHEFKTPVSVIKIAGNNIRSANQISDRERLHYGKILDEEADKLNDLMNRLLSFTQIENKAIRIKYENVNLEVFCQNLVDAYQIKHPNFEFKYQIEGITYFKSDPVLLRSIFQNLIDNAYKYSHPERKVLHIIIKKIGRRVVFRFVDKGIGIPKTEINNIFKKFYRIQSQYNQQGSVGLGLAFCKELINFMNGSIVVKSRVDKGSEFIITFLAEKPVKETTGDILPVEL